MNWLRRSWRWLITPMYPIHADAPPAFPSNVVNLGDYRAKRAEQVWTHTLNCPDNGQKFFLHRDGTIECCACSKRVPGKIWGDAT